MAIDELEGSGGELADGDAGQSDPDEHDGAASVRDSDVVVGEYTWADFMEEFGYGNEVDALYPDGAESTADELGLDAGVSTVPKGSDWDQVDFDPESFLGYHPDDLPTLITQTFGSNAKALYERFLAYVDPATTPVVKDVYTWEHYKWEYYYHDDGSRPRDSNGEIDRFDAEDALGFDPEHVEGYLHAGGNAAMALDELVEERTVNVQEDIDEDEFFSTDEGHTTVVNRYDLEKAVPLSKKKHFREEERYWVNKPYAFVILFHSEKENEKKYYAVEPHLNELEQELQEFLSGKLRTAIKYSEDGIKHKGDEDGRRGVIEEETRRLLKRYDLFEKGSGSAKAGLLETLQNLLEDEEEETEAESVGKLDGIEVRPEPVILEEDPDTLNEYQVEKLLYLLKRNFIGYERIDPIKYDINVEDISCDGYNSPVFVYHSEYEQIISNIYHGEDELDEFVVKLAQRSGKGISKRMPQVDATLPDGSRAQLTLGKEVSDHGTNYTIRQFKEVPMTPIDLINWNTFSLDQMAYLWLCIENHKSLIFAGGTASGKTTSLNAVSLFIPSNTKIVSIEDTREVELPQRNWVASVTRPSFTDDGSGDVDEFALLEAALRQRPDYIVMGEIRGEEGRTLFQVMSTGHTTYTTFHADSVEEVIKRFTTDPINVSKTMFTALDLISIQTQTRYQGKKVRRNKSLTEINHYEAEHDEINVQAVYEWQAETDEFLKMGESNTLDEIMFDRGWSREKLEDELFKRKVILAYLIKNELNEYAQVAATAQAFINDPETILTLIANGQLEQSLEDLRDMESVEIDVDPEKEEVVPRPDPTQETLNVSMDILERAEESMFDQYRGQVPSGLASALGDVEEADPITVEPDDDIDLDDFVTDDPLEELDLGAATTEFTFEDASAEARAEWADDSEFDSDDVNASGTDLGVAPDLSADDQELSDGYDDLAADASTGTVDDETDDSAFDISGPESAIEGTTADDVSDRTADSDELAEDDVLGDVSAPELEEADESVEGSVNDGLFDDQSLFEGETGAEPGFDDEFERQLDEGVESLFEDFEAELEAIESLESGDADPSRTDDESADGEVADPTVDSFDEESADVLDSEIDIDTSDFDTMFPDSDLESIFGTGDDNAVADVEDTGSSATAGAGTGVSSESESKDSFFGSDEASFFEDGTESVFDDESSGGDESSFFADAEDDPFSAWDDADDTSDSFTEADSSTDRPNADGVTDSLEDDTGSDGDDGSTAGDEDASLENDDGDGDGNRDEQRTGEDDDEPTEDS